jgi:hypothetical protein
MWNKIDKNFDIIIDDGLHEYDANIIFYENSIDRLCKDGLYVIEDVDSKYANQYIEYFLKNNVIFYMFEMYGKNIPDQNTVFVIKRGKL